MESLKDSLKKYLDEIVFIELKPDVDLYVGEFKINNEIPIPVMVEDLAAEIRERQFEKIPTVSILKGLITLLGAEKEPINQSYYVELLNSMNEGLVESLLHDALRYLEIKEHKRAILYLNACMKISSNNLDVIYYLARCYQELYEETLSDGYELEAARLYKKITEIAPELGIGFYNLGIFHYNRENYNEAEKLWIEALNLELDDDIKSDIVNFLGKCRDRSLYEKGYELVLSGRIDEGLEVLKALEEDHGEWWQLNFYIGLAYRFMEEFETALSYFLKSLSLNSGNIQTLNEIGVCLLSIGDYDEALRYYKEALRLEPLNAEIMCNQGIVYINKGEIEKGKTAIRKAYELKPDDEVVALWNEYIGKMSI